MGLRWVLVGVLLMWQAQTATAQTCDGTYVVVQGDSLSVIAERTYENAFLWTDIYQLNRSRIGDDPDRILPGMTLSLPCGATDILAETAGLEKGDEDISPANASKISDPPTIRFVTGTNLAPFSDAFAPFGGMFGELMASALRDVLPASDFQISHVSWEDLHSVASEENAIDVIFPVTESDCVPDRKCEEIIYSEPLYELLTVAFVQNEQTLSFTDSALVEGRRLCRPLGLSVGMFEASERAWLSKGVIELIQPGTPRACFELLVQGQVDAVILNQITGQHIISEMAIEPLVKALDRRPLEITGYRAGVREDHPQAKAIVQRINDGVATDRLSGADRKIIRKHLQQLSAGL